MSILDENCQHSKLTRQQLNDAAFMNRFFADLFECFNNRLVSVQKESCTYIDGTHACDSHVDTYDGGGACSTMSSIEINDHTACNGCA